MRSLRVPALVACALLLAVVAPATAKGVQEDPSTYPPGVNAVVRSPVVAGSEFNLVVTTNGTFSAATVFVCRFERMADATPAVCWPPFAAQPIAGGFSADSAAGQHPDWEAGWTIGYKLLLQQGTDEVPLPLSGDYYKVEVQPGAEDAARGSPAPAAALIGGLALVAAAIRPRTGTPPS